MPSPSRNSSNHPRTLRYGLAENLHGHAEISAGSAPRAPVGLTRTIERTVITKVVAAHVSVIDEPK